MYKDLQKIDHRPYPMPNNRWLMTQTWKDLLFIHWPVAKEEIEKHIPSPLQVDTFEGKAWIAIVPFWLKSIRLHGLPRIPFASTFFEINVRTYVTYKNRRGVYFFTLDANHLPAIKIAKATFFLPYLHATVNLTKSGDFVNFKSIRKQHGYPKATFHANYEPTSSPFLAQRGSLEEWLIERYNLLLVNRGKVYIGEIHHKQWELQHANVDIKTNELLSFLPSSIVKEPPLVHYSKFMRAFIWKFKQLK
ncbi:DUF2071 domain-containing protein [Bacillus sp. FJAT-47783]|uniref:YqjF family protein n=1 Tax=Bacillus sp. FJAT-47783 TaxID=2922712 RepID=UPI001FAB4B64|nr:DUF2071 domain-containing protein [Bacillus sp. FJAT-47783]